MDGRRAICSANFLLNFMKGKMHSYNFDHMLLYVEYIDTFNIVHVTAYTAIRSPSLGSWFVRILVVTFCRHAHSKDIRQLFDIVSL